MRAYSSWSVDLPCSRSRRRQLLRQQHLLSQLPLFHSTRAVARMVCSHTNADWLDGPAEYSRMISTGNPNESYVMKKYIGYTMIALFATLAVSTAASNEDLMQEKEKAAWQAFKDKKPDDFKKVVSAKFM